MVHEGSKRVDPAMWKHATDRSRETCHQHESTTRSESERLSRDDKAQSEMTRSKAQNGYHGSSSRGTGQVAKSANYFCVENHPQTQ